MTPSPRNAVFAIVSSPRFGNGLLLRRRRAGGKALRSQFSGRPESCLRASPSARPSRSSSSCPTIVRARCASPSRSWWRCCRAVPRFRGSSCIVRCCRSPGLRLHALAARAGRLPLALPIRCGRRRHGHRREGGYEAEAQDDRPHDDAPLCRRRMASRGRITGNFQCAVAARLQKHPDCVRKN